MSVSRTLCRQISPYRLEINCAMTFQGHLYLSIHAYLVFLFSITRVSSDNYSVSKIFTRQSCFGIGPVIVRARDSSKGLLRMRKFVYVKRDITKEWTIVTNALHQTIAFDEYENYNVKQTLQVLCKYHYKLLYF